MMMTCTFFEDEDIKLLPPFSEKWFEGPRLAIRTPAAVVQNASE
jgi:hypothetical protein